MGNQKKEKSVSRNRQGKKTTDLKLKSKPAAGSDPKNRETVSASGNPFYVVCLGASAGGLETLEQFFTSMPSDSGMAFIIVVHLDPNHKTLLPELLARYTRMDVLLAEEGQTVEKNTVYVIPANRDMTIIEGHFHLEEPLAPRGVRHTIDSFLRSLAADLMEYAIAVILSGTGTDGSIGVKAVKEAGGIVVVQEESTAIYAGMPQSAKATGMADLVLPVSKMPEKILEMTTYPHRLGVERTHGQSGQAADQLRSIFRIVHARTGHDFSSYKINTVMRRIERRMAVNEITEVDRYIQLLTDDAGEARTLSKEILIGVTSFFRDPEAFEALREKVIPKLYEDRDPDDPIRIWITGCATGEEAYSIAILLNEYERDNRLGVKVQVFATDLERVAVEHGRSGVYPDSISADVSPERLRFYFRKTESVYQVVKHLREIIVFAQHNVIKDPPFSKIDLLVCRNLLIYLNPEIQKRLFPLFFQAIKPGGFLFLGASETVGGFTDLFRPIDKKWKIFEKLASGQRIGIEFPIVAPQPSAPQVVPERIYRDKGISPGHLAEKTLIERYSPPCVVINEKLDVVYFSTRTARFLEPPVGEPSQNILKMAKEDLRPALRAAIHKVLSNNEAVVYKDLKVSTDGKEKYVNLRVEPITDPVSARGLAMVTFEPVELGTAEAAEESGKVYQPADIETGESDTVKDRVIGQLEEQLRITHEELQTTVERLETSNEELKSSNEELMSMNEEFQSTNEELETSKEELQALNEELVSVNAELQNKVEELSKANNDMENLLTSSDIAIVFLDRQLNVNRFSPAMARIFSLIQSDLGRPLRHISGKIAYPDLHRDAQKVLQDLVPIEREVTAHEEDRSYIMRVLPYRTTEDAIEGVVVTFVDISELKKLQNEMLITAEKEKTQRTKVEAILDAVPAAVLISHNTQCDVIEGNPAAYTLLRAGTDGEAADTDLKKASENIRVFRDDRELSPEERLIRCVSETAQPIRNFEEEFVYEDGQRIHVYGNAVPLLGEDGKPAGAVAAYVDITDRVNAEKELLEAKTAAEAANEAKNTFLANISHELRTPLTAVLGMLELLAKTGLNEDQKNYQEMAMLSGHSLLRLINEILDLARIEAGKLQIVHCPFDLKDCVEGAIALMAPEAEKNGLALKIDFPPRLTSRVSGDCDRVHQILFNLINNAIKFTEKGEIRITVRADSASRTRTDKIRNYHISISDTGIGIPAEKLESIFDSFTQVETPFSRTFGGAGLGLAICKKLVISMGGTIRVRSEVGKGSTFSFTIPLKTVDPDAVTGGAACEVPAPRPPRGTDGVKILVAEDDPILQDLMGRLLESEGYGTAIAGSGAKTLELWKKGTFDIILMDVQMPDMDGFETIRRLRKQETAKGTHTPVVAITAHVMPEFKEKCLSAGMDEYISKPVDFGELFSLVEKLTK